jgi:hypothetical protein
MDPYLASLPVGRRPGPIPRGGRISGSASLMNSDLYGTGSGSDAFQDSLDANLEYSSMGVPDDGQFQFATRGAFDKSTGCLPMDDLLGPGVLSTPGVASQPFRMPNGAAIQGRSGLTPGIGLLVFGSPNEQTGLTPNNDHTLLSDIACSREMSPYSPSLGIFSFETSPRRQPTPAGGAGSGSAHMTGTHIGGWSGQTPNYWGASSERVQASAQIHDIERSTPGICSPDLQKSLIALGVVRGNFSDDENDDPNEISAIDPVDASCVATDLDNSGTDLESSILEKVANSATVNSARTRRVGLSTHAISSPVSHSSPSNDSFNRSPSSANSSAINVTDATDVSQSSIRSMSSDVGTFGRRGTRNSQVHSAEVQASGRPKRKLYDLQQPEVAEHTAKRFDVDVEEDVSPESRETRSRRVRYVH